YDVWLSWRYSQEPVKFDAPLSFSYSGDHAFYVISKNTAVEMIKHYFEEYGLKYFIFRLPTIYAYNSNHYYYPNGIKTMRPIYQMIFKAVNGEGLEIWGDPKFSKDMTYVDDFAQMLCKAILVNRDNGFYNVGTGIPVTLEEQIRTIADVFSPKNKLPSIEYKPDKISGGGYLSDVSNAIKELNYKPEYDVRALFEAYKREMNLNTYNDLRK
ncbi:MAG: NAD(P)-dependent oxidoreductase, partial [Elusimicrobiota bacterium]|nr:NAD(P)-dependent oxidoreductase [Elusimicrobiota bacterium]